MGDKWAGCSTSGRQAAWFKRWTNSLASLFVIPHMQGNYMYKFCLF